MYFNQTRTVWFGRDFNRGVDDIHFGAWVTLAKECFDIVIPQTNTARTYPHANAEISVRTAEAINAARPPDESHDGPLGYPVQPELPQATQFLVPYTARGMFAVGVQAGFARLSETVVTIVGVSVSPPN